MRRIHVVAAFALWGCGDDVRGLTFETFGAAGLDARCSYLVRCGEFPDPPTCVAYFRSSVDAELAAALDAGKVVYDREQAQHCVDEQAAASCDLTRREARVAGACTKVFTGKVKDGDECAFDAECASHDCDVPSCTRDTCCPGTCKPTQRPSEIDGACEVNAHCVADTYCGKDHLCHALAAMGNPCDDDSQCDYGLGCIGATDLQSGTCRTMPLIGESCPYRRCAELGARCDATSTCVPVGLAGTACPMSDECSPFAHCDPAHQCADAPALGSACSSACAGDAWCNFGGQSVGVCAAPSANNEPCSADNECASSFCEEGPVFDFCTDGPVCF